MSETAVYAIRKCGGRAIRYTICRAYEGGCSAPIDGRLYRTEAAAEAAAAAAGIEIGVRGDDMAIVYYMQSTRADRL